MSALKLVDFQRVTSLLLELEITSLNFCTICKRRQRTSLKPVSDATEALLEKAVGDDIQNQAGWLIYNLKRLFPKFSRLRDVIDDFGSLPNYSSINEYQLQNHRKECMRSFET